MRAERILGVDPGLEVTGYGLVACEGRHLRSVASGTVVTDPHRALVERLGELHARFTQVLTACAPDIVVLEELYAHYQHPMTAILMGHARGVLALAVVQQGIPLSCYPPTHVKKAVTGNGHATKQQIQRMVAALLKLPQLPEPNDVSDALALALTHAHTLQQPYVPPPRRTRRALSPALQAALAETRS